jgi:hypothetical protein
MMKLALLAILASSSLAAAAVSQPASSMYGQLPYAPQRLPTLLTGPHAPTDCHTAVERRLLRHAETPYSLMCAPHVSAPSELSRPNPAAPDTYFSRSGKPRMLHGKTMYAPELEVEDIGIPKLW